VRRPGEPLGTRREIKNLNSFRFLQQAIEYEVKWQIETLEDGGRIHQATVLFDPASGQTRSMRSKEDAQDYRYFPDPDLLPLEIAPTWIASVKAAMPELPAEMRTRFERDYSLSAYDAVALTASREIAQYYEDCLAAAGKANSKTCANWIMGDLAARLNKDGKEINEAPVTPAQLASLVLRIADNTISNKLGKDVFDALWNGEGSDADAVIETKGLKQITDSGAIEKLIDEVLAANPKSVEEFRAGKEKAFNALVGQAMKATKGKANPQQVNELLRKKLAG
jgi:aspartyl-tRNA(Asn)/glutamyl-tRNA(Gln) amidotransferase subunit B